MNVFGTFRFKTAKNRKIDLCSRLFQHPARSIQVPSNYLPISNPGAFDGEPLETYVFGKRIEKVVPLAWVEVALMLPPCALTISRDMKSPKPRF